MPDAAEEGMGGALAVLRRAIHNEIAGQRFYLDASFACIDPWAKEVLASLAKDEEEHTMLLLLEYEALETRGCWIDPDTAMDSGAAPDITRFVFLEEVDPRDLFPVPLDSSAVVDRRSDDLDALALGIAMEWRAIALYGQALESATDPAAQRAYGFLVEEETRHHRQLKDQWERLAGMPYA